MAVKPILYSAPMVRALIAGTKTQTRRALNPQPHAWKARVIDITEPFFCEEAREWGQVETIWSRGAMWEPEREEWRPLKGLRYAVGDTLWVRETCRAEELTDGTDGVRMIADGSFCPIKNTPLASNDWLDLYSYRGGNKTELVGQTVTSIHMPRWASRLTQVVTDVRVQRLQDITEEDAIAEGVTRIGEEYIARGSTAWDSGPNFYTVEVGSGSLNAPTAKEVFSLLWAEINGPDSWQENPWVVAYTVETHLANVDAFLAGRGAGDG